MKNILIAIFILTFVHVGQSSKAQSMCAGIDISTFPLNPQTGSHNYFGVRVTLDLTYDQNITVSGYIYEDTYNTNTPFTLTINSGNLSNETLATFFAGTPALTEPKITISSVSPSTVTNSGITISTVCSASTPYDRINTVGILHNTWMNDMLSYFIDNNTDLRDTSTTKTLIASQLNSFLTANGFPTSSISFNIIDQDTGFTNFSFNPSDYSTAGAAILSSLQSAISNLDPNNDASFISTLASLQSDALALSDPNEVYTIGIPVTISIYSYSFYKNYAIDLMNEIVIQDSLRQSVAYTPYLHGPVYTGVDVSSDLSEIYYSQQASFTPLSWQTPDRDRNKEYLGYYRKPFQLNPYMVVGMDEVGAMVGAYAGMAGGPFGAIGGGFVGAAAGSLRSCVLQFAKWWLFG